jgi:hypothetical protein
MKKLLLRLLLVISTLILYVYLFLYHLTEPFAKMFGVDELAPLLFGPSAILVLFAYRLIRKISVLYSETRREKK